MDPLTDKACFGITVILGLVCTCYSSFTPAVTTIACMQMDRADQQCSRNYWTLCDGQPKKHEMNISKSSTCPTDFIFLKRSNTCFKIIHVDVLTGAAKKCASFGKDGRLPMLDWGWKYEDIRSYLLENMNRGDISVYIGAQRNGNTYRWSNGSEVKNAPWCPNQPQQKYEKYVTLWSIPGFCVDDDCGIKGNRKLALMCEIPM